MENILNIVNENIAYIAIGLGVIVIFLLLLTIILFNSLNKVEKKYRRMMRGANNKNIEQMILENIDKIEESINKSNSALADCENIRKEMKNNVDNVAILRYKAFEAIGGDLSFSVAILDGYNDGVVITSIYSRQESTTYAKPIEKGISRYDLSAEEIHVLNEAINKAKE